MTRADSQFEDEERKDSEKCKIKLTRSWEDLQKSLIDNSKDQQQKIIIGVIRTKLEFRFLYHPEYLELGSTLVIADSSLHAFGEITQINYDI